MSIDDIDDKVTLKTHFSLYKTDQIVPAKSILNYKIAYIHTQNLRNTSVSNSSNQENQEQKTSEKEQNQYEQHEQLGYQKLESQNTYCSLGMENIVIHTVTNNKPVITNIIPYNNKYFSFLPTNLTYELRIDVNGQQLKLLFMSVNECENFKNAIKAVRMQQIKMFPFYFHVTGFDEEKDLLNFVLPYYKDLVISQDTINQRIQEIKNTIKQLQKLKDTLPTDEKKSNLIKNRNILNESHSKSNTGIISNDNI